MNDEGTRFRSHPIQYLPDSTRPMPLFVQILGNLNAQIIKHNMHCILGGRWLQQQ